MTKGRAKAKPFKSGTDQASRDKPGTGDIRRIKAKPPRAQQDGDERFSRTRWLTDILRKRILDGTYQPGERIREVQLRDEFGFSNGPIREALQAVVADGLAERTPWHGVRIRTLDQRELLELFQVRLALLEYAAELAARAPSPAVLKNATALKQDLDTRFQRLERSKGHPSFDGKLSQWLLTSAGNEALHAIWDKTMQQTLIYVNASLRGNRSSRPLIDALIDAICAGKVSAARGAARDLTRQTLVDLGIPGDV